VLAPLLAGSGDNPIFAGLRGSKNDSGLVIGSVILIFSHLAALLIFHTQASRELLAVQVEDVRLAATHRENVGLLGICSGQGPCYLGFDEGRAGLVNYFLHACPELPPRLLLVLG